MDKQQILDEREKLEMAIWSAARAAGDSFTPEYFAAGHRIATSQRADRERLVNACAASGGHVFESHKDTCMLCGFNKKAAGARIAQNLTVGP